MGTQKLKKGPANGDPCGHSANASCFCSGELVDCAKDLWLAWPDSGTRFIVLVQDGENKSSIVGTCLLDKVFITGFQPHTGGQGSQEFLPEWFFISGFHRCKFDCLPPGDHWVFWTFEKTTQIFISQHWLHDRSRSWSFQCWVRGACAEVVDQLVLSSLDLERSRK